MKKVFGDNNEKTYQIHERSPYFERIKAMSEQNKPSCFGDHENEVLDCRDCLYSHQCRAVTLTKSMSDHQKAMEAAKPYVKEFWDGDVPGEAEEIMTLYITQIEIYDSLDERAATLSLEDGDVVKVYVSEYHTLNSWRELSAKIEQGMIKMGLTS